jgi:hypothetical protein
MIRVPPVIQNSILFVGLYRGKTKIGTTARVTGIFVKGIGIIYGPTARETTDKITTVLFLLAEGYEQYKKYKEKNEEIKDEK